MITLKRKQLEEFLKDLLNSIKIVKRPILILGDNDNERIEIFKGLKDKCSSSVDIWSPRRTDALMYECHKYGDISIDEEYVNWSVNILKRQENQSYITFFLMMYQNSIMKYCAYLI